MPIQKASRTSSRKVQSRNGAAYGEFVRIIESYPGNHRKIAASVRDFAERHGRTEREYIEKEVPKDLPDLSDADLAYALGVLSGIMIKEYRRKR